LVGKVPVIVITEAEDAPFDAGPFLARLVCQRAVEHVHAQLGPPTDIEDALCGPSAKEREIRPLRREGVLASVNAAPDVCESECADHSLADAIPLERGERAVWRCGLGAVVEFQPADGQRMSGAGALSFETDVCLLEKQGRVVRAAAIRGKVGCAQPELSL